MLTNGNDKNRLQTLQTLKVLCCDASCCLEQQCAISHTEDAEPDSWAETIVTEHPERTHKSTACWSELDRFNSLITRVEIHQLR